MTTTNEPPSVPLIQFDNPVWVLQARDGTKVFFDPDPVGTQPWSELLAMKRDLAGIDGDDDSQDADVVDRLRTILGTFCVDDESAEAWERSAPDLGLKKCLALMKVYAEQVADFPT